MIRVDPFSPASISDQIKAGLRSLVAKGLLRSGDAPPSIRSLAIELRVSPKAVARAFLELAAEGFLDSRGPGNAAIAGRHDPPVGDRSRARLAWLEAAREARRRGLTFDELEALLQEIRHEEESL